jgi:uncharacterized protein YodC (DUF2158 family)
MSKTFKPGDLVRLKSGGPKMTVQKDAGSNQWECSWFDRNGKLQKGSFVFEALEIWTASVPPTER